MWSVDGFVICTHSSIVGPGVLGLTGAGAVVTVYCWCLMCVADRCELALSESLPLPQ